MSRHNDELQQIHDRLLQIAEASSGQRRPLNVKRKVNVSRQGSKCTGPKLGAQDFVRMDPGYTAEIEHLVFPSTQKRRSPPPPPPPSSSTQPPPPPQHQHQQKQQQQPPQSFKPRSRLAEMFALSRHIEKSSFERQEIMKNRIASQINRSMDSATESSPLLRSRQLSSTITTSSTSSSSMEAFKRSTTINMDETTFRQNSVTKISNRTSPLGVDIDKSVNRGPNVSILHLRNNNEPWEKDGSIVPSSYSTSAAARSYFAASRSTTSSSIPPFTKHQSLTNCTTTSDSTTAQQKWSNSPSFHSGVEVNSPGIFSFSNSCQRELSPVRWCDREVDGVYLGKSGWVQVQQRSLDDNRRTSYSNNLTTHSSVSLQSNRTGIKLANYHFNSEPNKCSNFSRTSSLEPQIIEPQNDNNKPRPSYLLLQKDRVNCERKMKTPSPLLQSRSFSPPSVTPIISPPPAFQDKNTSPIKSRTFFGGKTPFLPRSNAIVDSDNSPPPSPLTQWRTTAPNAPSLIIKPKPVIRTSPGIEKPPRAVKKVPQAKSLEDSTASRRTQFKQKYGSSSSSSSSMGFRSLDSCLNRSNNAVMPRLSENTDSSIDVYEDADEEDNNSSSAINSIPSAEYSRKLSPSGRSNRTVHYRNQLRRSPAGSDSNKHSPTSSSSSNEFLSRSPTSQQTVRRNLPSRPPARSPQQSDDPTQRVRRSRSLQLPERIASTTTKIQPQQHPIKMSGNHYIPVDRKPYSGSGSTVVAGRGEILEEDLLREAAVVSGFVYGNRSKAAAQALLMHRYNNNISLDEKGKEYSKPLINNDLTVYYIGNNRNERQRLLVRGATSPNLPTSKSSFDTKQGPRCNYENCDFWPHCAHRNNGSLRDTPFILRPSQTYPSHQRSFDSAIPNEAMRSAAAIDRKAQKRSDSSDGRMRKNQELRKISPSRPFAATGGNNLKRNGSTEIPTSKSSPRTSNISGSSSGSDIWLTTSKVSSRKGSGASTPVESFPFSSDQRISPRPGSAPNQEVPPTAAATTPSNLLVAQQRSMSLPKSFQQTGGEIITPRAGNIRSGQIPWQPCQGTENIESSPGLGRKIPTPEIVHTAPVTPLHESRRGRSPLGTNRRTTKASSTPHLSDEYYDYTRNWTGTPTAPAPPPLSATAHHSSITIATTPVRNVIEINSKIQNRAEENCAPPATNETVLQKFCKTFSLRFPHRKSTPPSNTKNNNKQQRDENEDTASETVPSEDDDDIDDDEEEVEADNDRRQERENCIASGRTERNPEIESNEKVPNEPKSRFGPLIWRSSKERKKVNKSARSAKCNSGDSGIQIEMPDSNGILGDSSESHDTDGPVFDSPPILRRKPPGRNPQRPHSDLINRVSIDKFKTDLKQQQQLRSTTKQVRRSRSDLGGQRLLGWEQRQAARRLLRNMSSPHHPHRPLSPRKRPPDEIDNDTVVILRKHGVGGVGGHGAPPRRPALRRSLSQPIDIDKLSPLISRKPSDNVRTAFASEDEHDNRINSIGSNTSDEDTMSDSDVSSVASFNARKKSLELTQADEDIVVLAEAVFDHVAIENDELAFRAGDVIEVEDMADREWWWGTTNGKSGWFPAQFVRLRVSQEDTVEDCLAAIASGRSVSSQIRRRTSISLLSNDQVRTSVVRELVHTERDFVKVLQDVAEGYLSECRKRKDMFSDEQISTIFINLEEILKFQKSFLKNLETCVDWELPHKSCIGECFLIHSDGFKMYSDYCNSHPMATATLQELYQYNNYSKFFEACRLMRGLIEIPLDGYLLTPVQRICKYPLQLAELLKYTRTDHEDYVNIKQALEAMRGVAVLINERKRRMESLEKLAGWQRRVEGWEDEDLIETSSQLIHQGEVIRVTSGMWTNNITLFLFDHQLIYCKKDILKRSIYVYKGRLCLDTSEIQDVPDGKDSNLNVTVRHAIKLMSKTKDKWLMFCCRSLKEKQRWLDAFTEERQLVAKDIDDGLELSLATRSLAKVAAYRQKRPPRKLRTGKELKRRSRYIGSSMLQINMASTNSILSRKMGTWFNFGAGKKLRHRDVS